MTVTMEPAASGSGLHDLVSRTESLLSHRRRVAGWWVELVGCLDALGARAMNLHSESSGRDGLAEQIRMDAPHLYGNLCRLDEETEALSEDILKVRMSAGQAAGDDSRFGDLAGEIRSVLRRLRRLESRTNTMVYDAYDRDIGGE